MTRSLVVNAVAVICRSIDVCVCNLSDEIWRDGAYHRGYCSRVDRTLEHSMDDVNIPQAPPANSAGTSCEQQSPGRLNTITDACAAMKDEIASEAQQTIFGTEKTGKPPTFTEVCSTMKEQMADEAQHIVGVPPSNDPIGASEATSSSRALPHSQQIEQAKMALKEASWFEQ